MQEKPLAGIRVLEFGGYIAAPYATSLLASLGAEVIKIERPVVGEDFRRGVDNKSPYFIQYNGGKRSAAVDLKDPQGIEFVRRLIPTADVIVENLRPGKMDALGLGRDACTELRADLVYVSVTGFGNDGPLAQRPAYDMIGQAFGGMISLLSDKGAMQLTGTCLADLVTGLSTTAGILAALVARGRGAGGQHVETSIAEAMSTVTVDSVTQYYEDGKKDPHRQSRHPQANNFVFRTATEDFLTVHLSSSQKFWRSFLHAIGREDLAVDERFANYADRVRNYFELAPMLAETLATRPAAEWEERLIEHDVPFSPVHTISSLQEDPQMKWLDLYEPETDGVAQVRPPWRFDGERPHRDLPAPRVGEHTLEIAAEVCPPEEVEELLASGVIYTQESEYVSSN
ncbi:CaiB/BaiF CoA-transferase family protein [Arthrobacter sp. 08Y14]|uniref:CaiB/BaiF CoA transferase family protein n=1 Tax=Arthrobacter sp. 08Y14 TaxID=2058885 RepID=UPI000CE42B83|nr:CoA transferase [Arthrobacter sp. 08Y14]